MKKTILGLAAAVLLTVSASAVPAMSTQTPSNETQQQKQQQGTSGKHMKAMMQDCQNNMQSMRQSNEQLTKEIQSAKDSNNPAKMRSALDAAENRLDEMNGNMKMCANMMSMMQRMQGMGGMMRR